MKTPETSKKWEWLGNFRRKGRIIEIAIFSNQIKKKFEGLLKTSSASS